MLQRVPFTASPQSVALFFRGKMRNIPATDKAFEELYEHLKLPVHDELVIERLVDKPTMIERFTAGDVKVIGNGVYYKNSPLNGTLAEKLILMIDAGFDATNWARFLERVMANPSERSRECLYDFLAHWNAPITEDGHFIAFKRVRGTYMDIHSNTMDNSPGQIVSMPRDEVNDNPNETCSSGLHVAATSYLGSFYSGTEGYRVVACKVDPVDVVAVPKDYGSAKMRVCRYLVLGDAEESFYQAADTLQVYQVSSLIREKINGVKGRAICTDPVTFSQNWQRDIHMPVVVGTVVAPTAFSGEDLPKNKFMVGVVTSVQAEDETVTVEWQDGTVTVDAKFSLTTPMDNGVVGVQFVGEGAIPVSENEDPISDDLDDGLDDEDEDDDWLSEVDPDYDCDSFDAAEDEPEAEAVFQHNGVSYTASAIQKGVTDYGQRGYARLAGVPRTTLQEWLKRI